MATIELNWIPAVGAARYEVREVDIGNTGNTPLGRYEAGRPLGPRVDSTRFVFSEAEFRPYLLSVRAYNRAGVASPEPVEILVEPSCDKASARMPTDVDCVMYISFDEKYDQNGEELKPQIWNNPLNTSNVAPPGTDEWRRRLRYDQGIAENHMVIQMDSGIGTGGNPPSGQDFPEARKSSPSNRHFEQLANPDTAAGRGAEFWSSVAIIVERRDVGFGPQTDVDFLDNFTLAGWVNPCNLSILGSATNWIIGGQSQMEIWARVGVCDILSPSDIGFRGWSFWLGGPPSLAGSSTDPHPSADQQHRKIDGFTFAYLLEGDRGLSGSEPEQLHHNAGACLWPYNWRQDLEPVWSGLNPGANYGDYCGWLFAAVTISPAYTKEGFDVDVSDFECWVGRADKGDIRSLGIITQERIRSNMWTNTTTPRDDAQVMMAIHTIDSGVVGDLHPNQYENKAYASNFCMYDEMRVYRRALTCAEIIGLYNHPGGQKRTENLLEAERQVLQP